MIASIAPSQSLFLTTASICNVYRYETQVASIPAAYPSAEVPTNSVFLLDNGNANNAAELSKLWFRNSFHWGPKQYQQLSTTDILYLGATDFKLARLRHWLDSNSDSTELVSDRISIERAPSPDGVRDGQKTWFSYYGKSVPHRVGYQNLGDELLLGFTGEVLTDGSSRFHEMYYRGQRIAPYNFPQRTRSTFTETNGTVGLAYELLRVRQ